MKRHKYSYFNRYILRVPAKPFQLERLHIENPYALYPFRIICRKYRIGDNFKYIETVIENRQ
jgi:hypothetical protein